jgi:ribosomal protein S18 acetylase RimI-like enzyme
MELAKIRQIEAVGFRAWPAASVYYDGTWAIRMTPSHPSKRLNSVNPLDPGDTNHIEQRVEMAAQQFRAHGRPLVFRLSSLAPKELEDYLAEAGWNRFDESMVMTADLADIDLSDAINQLPQRDIGRFIDAALEVQGENQAFKPGLFEVISAIRPSKGLFVTEDGGIPVASAICVKDGELAGLFNIGTAETHRRRGLGRTIIKSALRWAGQRGAQKAWLQVDIANTGAVALYQRMGFKEAYRYAYRQAPA